MFLSRRQAGAVFLVLVGAAMALAVSLALTLANHRLDAGFVDRWLRAFLIALVVAVPTGALVVPGARRVADRLTRR